MEKPSNTKAPKPLKDPTVLEARFMTLWDVLGGSELVREHRFAPPRRWRADFASLETRVLIEIEGGVWQGNKGRHTNPVGFMKDAEKYLTATLEGWTVLRLTVNQLNEETIAKIVQYVRERISE